MLELILASQSPRRSELLNAAHFEFRVSPVKVSEIIEENLTPSENVSHLATVKAEAFVKQNKPLKPGHYLILAADTLVALGDQILGKPRDAEEAHRFLRLLSGKTHSVITGLCLIEIGRSGQEVRRWSGFETTLVQFRDLAESEIRSYIATGEPMDKAGAYGIQGAAKEFVSSFQGSWSNVVGLPLEKFESVLKENGWDIGRRKSAES